LEYPTRQAPQLSIVVPLYDEAESLPELVAWIDRVAQANSYTYEVILIDDGSKDESWSVIERLAQTFPAMRGIKFQRNYGKSAALNEGFRAVRGDVVITMDADLQDSPDEIPELYHMIAEQGFDLVSGWKQKRYDPLMKTIPSKFFNWTTRMVSGIRLNDFNCGLKAYRRKVVKSIEVYGEMHRYIPFLAKMAGFRNIGEKVVQHRARKYGKTKFGLERFVRGFLDLISLSFVLRYGRRPMHFFGLWGSLSFMAGFFATIWIIVQKLVHIYNNEHFRDVVDQPLFYIALTMLVVGLQLFLAGYLGELINRSSPTRNEYLVEARLQDGITVEEEGRPR
jgi:glycosyltransferase involved in cell wall biosynthesis